MKRQIKNGTTSLKLRVFIPSLASATGAGLTGLTYNSAGLVAAYFRDGDTAATPMTLATATVGTWTSNGFVAVDATNMPGVYELGVPNAALTVNGTVEIILQGATNMGPCNVELEVIAADFQNATNLNLSALPAATAGSATGLLTFASALPAAPTPNTVGESLFIADILGGRANTAQAGASSTITLDAGASSDTNAYVGDDIYLYGGTGGGLRGSGQRRTVLAYNPSTKVATVNRPWDTIPNNTTTFITIPQSMSNIGLVDYQIATAAAGVTFPATISAAGAQMDLVNSPNPTALAAIASAVLNLANGVETGMTPQQALRVMTAALAGLSSGNGTVFRDVNNTTNRISATVDSNGNRTAVTLNAN